jgi:alpha-1,3-mannosyltransferase
MNSDSPSSLRTLGSSRASPESRLRVLHVCRRYYPLPGGTEKYVRDLARAQVEAGLEVTVLTLDRDVAGPARGLPGRERLDGIEVVRLPGRGGARFAVTYRPDRIWREIARHDVVHIHDLRFATTASILGGLAARRPRIFHTHGLIFHTSTESPLKRLAMRFYFGPLLGMGQVGVVADSPTDRSLLLRDAPYLARRTHMYLDAIPLAPLLGLQRRPLPARVVSIGRIVSNKALTDLVRAMARIDDVDWSLVLAGEADPGELERIRKVVDELAVRDRVTFVLGFPEADLPGLLESAALAAFPSTGEGFGLALLEAMAAAVPLLANRIPAHEALLGEDLAGQLVDFGDPAAAGLSIRTMIQADPAALAELSSRLRARAAGYDIARLAAQIDELYDQLGVGRRKRRRSNAQPS